MLPFDEYTNGWIVYAIAIVGLLFIFWRMVRHIPWQHVRQPLFLSGAVFLLTPSLGTEGYWAPAWVIGTLELLFSGLEAAQPIFMELLVVLLVVLIIYTLGYIGLHYYRKKYRKQQTTSKPNKADTRVVNRAVG